jgi:predicted O-methyltransferase YrrM
MNLDKIADESRASIEHEDLKILLPIVAKIEPKVILEIGMHRGYSMETWRKAFNPEILIGLEIDSKPEDAYDEIGFRWEADSHMTQPNIPPLIDFLFIDGDHSLEGVMKDWIEYSHYVKSGGIIAFHDVLHYNKDPEVNIKPLWEELKTKYPYVEIKVGQNSTGIGVIWQTQGL